MLQLYDVNKNKVKGLTAYKDYCIESVLKTGDKTLSFLYPKKLGKEIKNEGYLRNKTDEFVIKSIDTQDDWLTINASLNVEDLEGKEWESFSCLEQTIEQCLTLACAGTGWTVKVTGVTKKRTVRMTNCNSWDIIQQARKTYLVEYKFDTINKIIIIKEKQGQDKGTYFTEDLNLKKLDINNDSYDFFTRIKPIGKNNLKISVNGKDYLENYQYSNKAKTLIWKDERYTVVANLIEDATIKLNELSKPRVAYAVDIIDLAKLSSKYKNILDYSLGDTIYLVSKENNVREKQRIVKTKEYPDEAERNSCEIANTIFTFEDIQKEYRDTVDTVDNITSDNGTVSEGAIRGAVESIIINKANITELNAAVARIGSLESTKANITDLTAINANISNLQVNKANITDLTATNIKFDVGEGGTLSLQTLLSKFVTGENGQYLNLTTDNVVIANAVIKDTIASNISVQDLKAGNIDANRFNIVGTNGNLLIKDNTIQIKDSNRVRVQIGKDASNDYNMYVWDATGKLMFDATGLKADGIKSKIIRDDMVSDTANISGSKINISSLITEVNKDTNTQTIKGNKVYLDTIGQSLEVSFNSLKTSSDDTKSKTEINTTSIGIINGQIDTLIKDTTIEENGSTIKLKDSYSSLKQTVNGINTTVSSHTTSITSLGTNVTNAQNTANSANTLADSKAKVFTVTPTTPYKVGDIWTGGPSGELMKCKVSRASGSYVAADWEKASKYTDDTKANAVEGNLNTLSGKVTTVENNYTSLSQDLSGFKTTVGNTYSTKTELSLLSGTVTNINARVSTTESSITQLNNKIDLKVEQTDITNAMNGILVGGRNLVKLTKMEENWLAWNTSRGTTALTSEGTKLTSIVTGQNAIVSSLTINPKIDDIFTVRFRAKGNLTALEVYLLATSGTNEREYYITNASTVINEEIFTEIKVTFTFKNTNTNPTNRLFIGGQFTSIGQWLEIERQSVKLERGNKATDWTPAPEDIDSAISTVDSKITTTNTKVATIETNLTSITSRVSSTESSISTINGNVSSLTSRMSSAESKITSSAIISTVQATINAAKTDAINSANSSTDTKLQSYATKASMELTATQLKLDFSSSGGYNLIRNGNFENGTYGWTTQVFGGDNSELSVSTTGSNDWIISNKKALWCFTNIQGAKERTVRQEIQTVPGKTYTLSYYIAGHRSTKVVRIRDTPNWNDLITPRTYGAINGGNSPSGWIYDSLTFTATSTTTLIFFDLRDIGTNTDGYMWVHDVTVVEGSLANPWIPNKEEIVNGSTVINGSGVTIYNGAITVKNNANVDVLKGDSSGNLTMRGVFEQYASSGKKSVDITNNKVNLYDWSRDGDLVGGIISVTGNVDGRGKVMVYGDKGNPLLLGYCNLNRDTYYRVIAIDDVKVENSGQSMIGIYKDTSIMDYSSLTFYGNDNTVPIGRVGLSSTTNNMFLLSRDSINSTIIGQMSASNSGSYNSNARINGAGLYVWGNIECSGTKTRVVPTQNFDGVKLNALETPEPVFEDIGEGRIEKEGLCYIFLDPIMQETINSKCSYQVFLQKYGEGDLFVLERTENYFVIKGLAGLKFGWRFVAKQKGYETDRLEREVIELPEGFQKIEEKINEIDELTHKYLSDYEKELIENGEY